MRRLLMRRSWLSIAAVLFVASAAALAWLASAAVIPSAIRNPLSDFVAPGVTAWWFVLGGPFRSAPHATGGVALAAVANTLFWLPCLWLVACVFGAIQRRIAARLAPRRARST